MTKRKNNSTSTPKKTRNTTRKNPVVKKPTLREQVNTLTAEKTSLVEEVERLSLDNQQLHEIASENILQAKAKEVQLIERDNLIEEIKEELKKFVEKWKSNKNFFYRFWLSYKLVRQIIGWAEDTIDRLS
jgi:DNA primase